MLCELAIEDLALFERAHLAFGPGLNVITGETGAGKSLLVGALELLLGERPRARLLRKGARGARVDGRFTFASGGVPERLAEWLGEHAPDVPVGLEGEQELELVLARTLDAEGRTRAYLDGRPVTRKKLRELAALLIEIHGQNDHQRLFEPDEQRRLIDLFGGLQKPLAAYRRHRAEWLELERRVEAWRAEQGQRRDRLDLLRFQVGELAALQLAPGESAALRRERELLRHAEALAGELGGLVDELSEGEPAALDAVRHAQSVLERWAERVPELETAGAQLREAALHLEEGAHALRAFVEGLDCPPGRLEEVESRLAEVERLERRHGARGDELLARFAELDAERVELEGAAEDRAELELACERARARLERSARALGSARRRLCAPLKKEVERRLTELGLERARIEVRVEPRPEGEARFAAGGADEVELFLAANPGEGFQALRQVASGGEAARVMLALRGALAARQTIPSLVFDEVDAGVGGRLAPRVGAHLRELGEHYQIVCVTHLPAVAAAAHRHLKVEKQLTGGRTRAAVTELTGARRVAEVADMIAGGGAQATARAEARRLLAGIEDR